MPSVRRCSAGPSPDNCRSCGELNDPDATRTSPAADAVNVWRTAGAVEIVGAALVVLGFAEIRQHIVIAPAGVAQLAPVIEVLGLTADVDQSVDRTRSPERLAARRNDIAAVAFCLWLGLVAPV